MFLIHCNLSAQSLDYCKAVKSCNKFLVLSECALGFHLKALLCQIQSNIATLPQGNHLSSYHSNTCEILNSPNQYQAVCDTVQGPPL